MDGKLLRGDFKGTGILTEGRSRIHTAKVEDEEIDQIS